MSEEAEESSVPESLDTAAAAVSAAASASCWGNTGFVSPTVIGDSWPDVEDVDDDDSPVPSFSATAAVFFWITESSLKPDGGSGI